MPFVVTSLVESEFLLPITKSRSDDDSDDTELSLFRLFRPLHDHDDFVGVGEEEAGVLAGVVAIIWEDATAIKAGVRYCRLKIRNWESRCILGRYSVSRVPASISNVYVEVGRRSAGKVVRVRRSELFLRPHEFLLSP